MIGLSPGHADPVILPAMYWDRLLKLNGALLDELLPHKRRTLILDAIVALTGHAGGLWASLDGRDCLQCEPDFVQRTAETHQPSVSAGTEPLLQALPLFDRQTKQFIGVVYGAFACLPAEVTSAFISQIQLIFQITTLDARSGQLATIAEVSRAIVSELNLDNLIRLVVDLLHDRFGYRYVHLFVVHHERRWIEFKAGLGLYATHLNRARELSFSLDGDGLIPWVARTGQSALLNDVSQDVHFRPLSLPGIEIQSELAVPLVFGDEVLGVFDLESESLNAFTPDDQWLLETLAANIAIAFRNAMLYRSERWRRKSAESLRLIAGVVRSKETLDNILHAILEQLADVLPSTFAAIWLKNGPGYRFKAGYQTPADLPPAEIENAWLDKILTQKISLVRRPVQDGPAPLTAGFPADHSAVGAVMAVDENVLGVLVLVHRLTNRFGRESRQLLEIFAGQAAIVIENTDLYHRAKKQAWMSTALLQVAEATRHLQTLDEVLSAVTRISPMIAGVNACAIFLRHQENQTHYCAAVYGLPEVERAFLENCTLSDTNLLAVQLAVLKRPVMISERENAAQLPAVFSPFFAAQTLLFLPLLSQGDLNGIMMMVLNPEQDFSDENLYMLNGIAYQAASAIQTAQLIEAQQAEAYVSTALLQVAQIVVLQSDLSEVLGTVARITPMLTGVNHCLVFLYNGGPVCTLAACYGPKTIHPPLEITLADFPLLQAALTEGDARTIGRSAALPAELAEVFTQPQVQGLILPLMVKNNPVGALLVIDDQPRPLLPGKRRDILTGIAYQIALAIDNARLYAERTRQEQFQRELELARDIQKSFIPLELPNFPGWELASFLKMAREVGGDFFDIISMPRDRLLLIIADVADKGLPASLFMARTSSLVRVVALEVHQPAQILSRVNHLLVQDAQGGMFVTAFCAVIDLHTGELRYASAGHNPPILIRKSGEMTLLQTEGIVLGVVDDSDFEQKTTRLYADDTLLLYTDGVTEAFNAAGDMFGEARLLDTLQSNCALPPADLIDKIQRTVFDFAHPHPQSDDLTLLLLQKKT